MPPLLLNIIERNNCNIYLFYNFKTFFNSYTSISCLFKNEIIVFFCFDEDLLLLNSSSLY